MFPSLFVFGIKNHLFIKCYSNIFWVVWKNRSILLILFWKAFYKINISKNVYGFLVGKWKKLLDVMARLLVERETIFTEEVDMIMEGKSVEEIMAFMDENERTLQENPFNRKSAKSIIVPEPKTEEIKEQPKVPEDSEKKD